MVLGAVIAGASGGALANVALSPLSGGAGMIQSYWYGAGLILGERDMYTFHWEKIKKRLENGEDYLSVLESEMNPAITAIANYSLQIMQKTGEIYLKGGVDFMAQLIENLFKVLAGEIQVGDIIPPVGGGGGSQPPFEPTLITLTQEEIINMSITQLQQATTNNRSQYTADTIRLLEAQLDRLNFQEPFDPEQEFPNIPDVQTIPLISTDGLFTHSIARVFATFGSDNRATYRAQTNPQRNGNWQTKQSFTTLTARADARAWIENNVDITNTNQYSVTDSTAEKNGFYYIKKDKITIQNFPQ